MTSPRSTNAATADYQYYDSANEFVMQYSLMPRRAGRGISGIMRER